MAITVVDICNGALSRIGDIHIVALADSTRAAILCKRFYERTLEELLRMHDWNFAVKRRALSQLSATIVGDEWTYHYQLPSDPWCLRVLEVLDSSNDYRIEGRELYTNDEDVNLRYIARIEDVTLLDSIFVSALECRIASKLAMPLTQSKSLRDSLLLESQMLLEKAWHTSGKERGQPVQANTAWADVGR